jgi:hypothetical protein
MHCPKCGHSNPASNMFCLGCGARMAKEHAPAGEPGGQPVGMAPQGPQGPRCGQCGGGRTVQGAVGPQMGVRVLTAAGRYEDLPLSTAWICVDCGCVAMSLPEDARRYLAGAVGR